MEAKDERPAGFTAAPAAAGRRGNTPALWLGWAALTAAGWAMVWLVAASMGFSAAVYDPDEVDAFIRAAPLDRFLGAVLAGGTVGVALALFVGLFRGFGLRRGVRDVALSVAVTVLAAIGLCWLAAVGPSQLIDRAQLEVRVAAAGGVVGGAFAAAGQWALLRMAGYRADGWVIAAVATWAAGGAVMGLAGGVWAPGSAALAAAGLVAGALVGAGQAWLLRGQVSGPGWVLAANALCWGAAALTFPRVGLLAALLPGLPGLAVIGHRLPDPG